LERALFDPLSGSGVVASESNDRLGAALTVM
jgi:hypothetical protein